jgi:ribosomal protein S1
VEIGQIVDARIVRIEEYGLYLDHDGKELFAHMFELSWTITAPGTMRGYVIGTACA